MANAAKKSKERPCSEMKAVAVVVAAASYSRPSSIPKLRRINFKFFSFNCCLLLMKQTENLAFIFAPRPFSLLHSILYFID